MNRALRAATMGVLLLSPVALAACSAGQVTQTAGQERDKTGAQAQVGDILSARRSSLSPRGGSYEQGDDAELRLALVNSGDEDDTLVGVEGEGFGSAEIEDASTGTATARVRLRRRSRSRPGPSVFVGDDADAHRHAHRPRRGPHHRAVPRGRPSPSRTPARSPSRSPSRTPSESETAARRSTSTRKRAPRRAAAGPDPASSPELS